ncbi:transposase IS116/IS110/IS902 family protein [Paenibacillus mucilaginosus 3016]|uniref:Transposase IS116/IS110/IS902 family protein n=1 Tax=Paenibacillus mucilaginosus 3016 TaxID=1116391 RepID=H6N9N3_9BACL|nr:transposase IS116/IS110/IS902 family protein [Paenibacillus mucilaginosus 3016]
MLEGANIKLASVVSDIMGVSSRDMLEAMVNGETDPEKLAGFARRTMKKKKEELELALRGSMTAHQRLMLKSMLTHIDFLNEQIIELDTEVAKRLDPFRRFLYLMTMCMVMTNPDVKALHQHNVREKKLKKMKSIMKLCGKVARMLVGLAKSSEGYSSAKVFPQAA